MFFFQQFSHNFVCLQFQCAFYENALQINFHDGSEKMHKQDPKTKSQAFKVTKDAKSDKWITKPLDIESAAVNYAETTFDPINTVWNMSEASLCSEHCLRMLKNNVANCQTAIWKNYQCKIYAFNSSNVRIEDFDQKTIVKGYNLKEQEGTLSSLLLKFKSVNYTEKFRQIRHLGPFLNPLRGRRAYESVIVKKPEECFENCLEKWIPAAISKQRRLCRFVIIRNISKDELECSLYSHNATQAMQSIRVASPKRIRGYEFDAQADSSTVASWNGSIYRNMNWSLPLPVAVNNIKKHELNHLGDCLAECDELGSDCIAMLTEYSEEDDKKIKNCYTISDGDYTPAESFTEQKSKRNMKMFVKIINIDTEMRQRKDKNSDDRESRSQNPFISLLKFVTKYERQQQLAELFNSL